MYNRENCYVITTCTPQHSTILDVRFSTENVNKKSACISCHSKAKYYNFSLDWNFNTGVWLGFQFQFNIDVAQVKTSFCKPKEV